MPALSVRTNAAEIAADLRRLSKKYPEVAQKVVQAELDLALESARKYSSLSDHSLRDLRRMDHPYATRAPRPPHAAHLIHNQGGRFLQAWRAFFRSTADGAAGSVTNDAPYAAYLQTGTRKMVERPILQAIADDVRRRHKVTYYWVRRSVLGMERTGGLPPVRGGFGVLGAGMDIFRRVTGGYSRWAAIFGNFLR